jgi:predicted glycosyltransferase
MRDAMISRWHTTDCNAPDGEILLQNHTPGRGLYQWDGGRARAIPGERRIALYSHDTQGLGHVRRNLAIAEALSGADSHCSVLLIAGVHEVGAFTTPPGVDCLALPSFAKGANGQYRSRSLHMLLQDLVVLRANIIRAALRSFQPDVLIVDKVPLGLGGELESSLEMLCGRGRTRCVLGLRDILDDPVTVRREWQLMNADSAVGAFYDAVWVYGDPALYDPVHEYGFSREVAAKVRYTGCLGRWVGTDRADDGTNGPLATLDLPPGQLALCLVGGGQDGYPLARAFAGAEGPPDTNRVVVTGPFMEPDAQRNLHAKADTQPRLKVLEFIPEMRCLLSSAESVVAMGGYNTTYEILSCEKRSLIVPRVQPRQEQLIRAERLRDLGLVDVLHPDDLTSEAITEWLARGGAPPWRVHDRIDLAGLTRLPSLLAELAGDQHLSGTIQYRREVEYAAL